MDLHKWVMTGSSRPKRERELSSSQMVDGNAQSAKTTISRAEKNAIGARKWEQNRIWPVNHYICLRLNRRMPPQDWNSSESKCKRIVNSRILRWILIWPQPLNGVNDWTVHSNQPRQQGNHLKVDLICLWLQKNKRKLLQLLLMSELGTGCANAAATITSPSELPVTCATWVMRQASRWATCITMGHNRSRIVVCQPALLATTPLQNFPATALHLTPCPTHSWTNSSQPWESASCTFISTSIRTRCSHRLFRPWPKALKVPQI